MALAAGIFTPLVLRAATDNHLAVNVATGLAIRGFDPVAYFTESAKRYLAVRRSN
jgi:hypothetical protein